MTREEDINAALTDLNTAVDRVAALMQAASDLAVSLQATIDQLNATAGDSLNAAQTEAAIANMEAAVARLNQMGTNVGQPLPPAVAPTGQALARLKIPGPMATPAR